MKILVAVPTFENICPETFKSIYDLHTGGHEVNFDFVKGYTCDMARNKIADKAIEGGCDYVLMIDSDITVPEDTIERFLDSPVDICFGVCPRKNTKDGKTAIAKVGQTGFHDMYTMTEIKNSPLSRIEIKGAGAACAFIKTSVFKKLEYPWFQYVSYKGRSFLSEDFYFCNSAIKAGYIMWADTRVKCGHLVRGFQYE